MQLDIVSSENLASVDHVLLMVHGIRDLGAWQDELKKTLSKNGIASVSIRYGYYDLFQFLFPFPWFRNRVVRKISRHLREVETYYPNAQFSFLAHSFGTYLVGKLFLQDPNLRAKKVIFCGSVLSDTYIERIGNRFDAPLINEIGIKDYWPIFAKSVTWGYGSTGSNGFDHPIVHNRFHSGGHSYFLTSNFARRNWIPFLKEGKIVEGINRPKINIFQRIAISISIKYSLVFFATIASFWFFLERPDQSCTDRWLNSEDLQSCFNLVKSELSPTSIEGKRSFFDGGKDVFKIHWRQASFHICYFLKANLGRSDFKNVDTYARSYGYFPEFVDSFNGSDGIELFQIIWTYALPASEKNCPIQ